MVRRVIALAAASLALGGPVWAQQNVDNVTIETTRVSGPLHMLHGSGGNIGVSVGEDGMLMIDDQYAPLADRMQTDGVPAQYESWGAGCINIERWLELVSRSLGY